MAVGERRVTADGRILELQADGSVIEVPAGNQAAPGMLIKPAPAPPPPPEPKPFQAPPREGFIFDPNSGSYMPANIPAPQPEGTRPKTDKRGAYQAVINQIDRLQELYAVGPGATKGMAGIADYLPFDANAAFDTAGAALADIGMAAFKVPGVGAQSDADAARFVAANQPSSGDRDVQIIEKLRALRQRVESNMQADGLGTPQWKFTIDGQPNQQRDDAAPGANVPPVNPLLDPANSVGARPQQEQFARGGASITERDRQVQAALQAQADQGADFGTLSGMAQQLGYDLPPGLQEYMADPRNVGRPPRIGTPETGQGMGTLGNLITSPAGTAATMAVNATTLGGIDEIGGMFGGPGTTQAIDAAKGMMRAENPMAAMGGEIAGAIPMMLGGGALAARALPALSAGRAGLLADVVYGTASGAGEQNSNRLGGAALGGGLAGIGSAAGTGIARGVGSAVAGVSDPAVRYLSERGIPLSVGQILGNRGIAGKTLNAMESAPLLGPLMGARRADSVQGFNRVAMEDAMAPINAQVTATGREGLGQMQQATGQAYDSALAGVNINADPMFMQGIGARLNETGNLGTLAPDAQQAFQNATSQYMDPTTGAMTGKNIQNMQQDLVRRGGKFGRSDHPLGYDAEQVFVRGQGDLADLVNRQAPGVMGDLSKANEAYRNQKIIQDAIFRARNGTRTGEADMFAPSQLRDAAEANAKKYGGQQATANVPFNDLTSMAQDVIPSSVPNSGTADRMAALALPVALGGAAGGSEYLDMPAPTTAALAALAALSTKQGGKAAQAALVNRPAAARRIGEAIKKRARVGGIFGAPLLLGQSN